MNDFRDALLWHMSRNQTKIAELAKASGVSPDIIKKVRTRPHASTNAEDASKIAAYYGKSVAQFIRCEDVPSDQAIGALVDLLTPTEKQVLEAQVRAMLHVRGLQ